MTAYERLVPEGDQVPYFIYFTVKPEDIDVNIHPTKTEIKFENEPTIWQILAAAVKDAVGMFSDVTAIEFDTEGQPDIPALGTVDEVRAPKLQYNPSYNPFNEPQARRSAPSEWQTMFDGLETSSSRQRQTSLFDGGNDMILGSKANRSITDTMPDSQRHSESRTHPDSIPNDCYRRTVVAVDVAHRGQVARTLSI